MVVAAAVKLDKWWWSCVMNIVEEWDVDCMWCLRCIWCIEQGLLDAPLIAVRGSKTLPDKTKALLLDCCDTTTTRVFLLEYAREPQEKRDDVGATTPPTRPLVYPRCTHYPLYPIP